MQPGYRIITNFERPQKELVDGFARIDTAQISDNLGRYGTPNCQLLHIGVEATTLCGPAFTVRTRPTDNLLIHKALQLAQPGDVIVVDGQGDYTTAYLGELMSAQAKVRGLAGFVVDGLVRDPEGIARLGLPVFARGVTPRGPYKDGPGEINVTISIGGISVAPGDIVVGDRNGVVVIPREGAEQVYEQSVKTQQVEEEKLQQLLDDTADTSWIDARLRELGYELE